MKRLAAILTFACLCLAAGAALAQQSAKGIDFLGTYYVQPTRVTIGGDYHKVQIFRDKGVLKCKVLLRSSNFSYSSRYCKIQNNKLSFDIVGVSGEERFVDDYTADITNPANTIPAIRATKSDTNPNNKKTTNVYLVRKR